MIKIGMTVKDKGEKGTVIGFHRYGIVLQNGYGWRWVAQVERVEEVKASGRTVDGQPCG